MPDSFLDQATREAARAAWKYLYEHGLAPDPEAMLVDAPGIWEQHLDSLEEMLRLAGFERLRAKIERLTYTLDEITQRAWWENALDPQWPAQLARERLAQEATRA